MTTPSQKLVKELRSASASILALARIVERVAVNVETLMLRTEPEYVRVESAEVPAPPSRQPRAGLRVQGAYMSLLRQLPAADRAAIKQVYAKRGVEVALKVGARLAKKARR